MKKLGHSSGASLLFVPMPLYAAGIGSSNQVFTHTGWFSVICMAIIRCWSCELFKTSEITMKKVLTVSIIWAVDLFYLKFEDH